jgi:kynurenine formamidase
MKIVDLTLTLQSGMRGVEFETKCTVAQEGWNARTLHLFSHCGTHMDAQVHFDAGPQTIDQIPLETCLGPAWVVSLDDLAPRTLITVDHLAAVATELRSGDGLLLRTGWSRHVEQPDYYRSQFPRISVELARWCAEQRLRILGVEPPSVADVNDLEEVTAVHKILLGGEVGIVEGLTNLEALGDRRVFFGALPLKIATGDGAPCRAFAIEGDWSTPGD